jgi:hypothetical protein
MTSLSVEIEGGDEGAPVIAAPAHELLAFCSFAFATRFGAQHDLALLAQRLKDRYKVDLRPFTTYVQGIVHEAADAEDLERAWQDAGRVETSARQALEALRSGDPKLPPLLEEWPGLPDRLAELEARSRWAAEHGRRVRLTFDLE